MSVEYKSYLKKIKQKKIFILIFQISIVLIIGGLWQLFSDLEIINTFIFSSPKNVIKTIISLINSNNFFIHIWTTLYETIISFVIGTILGLFVASLMWWFKSFAKIIEPFLVMLNSLPKVALGPIIIIWAGANIKSIIIMALLISTIITVTTIFEGFKKTDETKIKLLKSFNANRFQIYCHLILPNSFNIIIGSLKLNVSMSLVGIIMGEFLTSKSGIGYLILYGSQVFNLNLVMTGIFLLILLSTILYIFITYIEKKLIH